MRSLVDLDISASGDEIQNGVFGRWNKGIRDVIGSRLAIARLWG
jgi:hypothetical protein